MSRLAKKDWYSSLLVVFIGLATILGGKDYGLGSLARMGPGYYPVLLGGLLVFIGLLLLVAPEKITEAEAAEEEKTNWVERSRPWILVTLAMIVFMTVGKYGGFVPATFLLITIAALGDRTNSLKLSLILAACVTIISVIVFGYLLQIQFPLFTWG